jgi:hypothetical protein
MHCSTGCCRRAFDEDRVAVEVVNEEEVFARATMSLEDS